MKTKLKIKISLVLAASIILNIFLIWEVFRLRNELNQKEDVIYKLLNTKNLISD